MPDKNWSERSFTEKFSLIWGMRIVGESFWKHLNPKTWLWRYKTAKLAANVEAKITEEIERREREFDYEYDEWYEKAIF